jgi:2-polyprenyl-6-methoxyphenol hydroxylase-like FAD-dependent oxidoreductase
MQRTESVLVSGASFAGLATAWWLRQLGYLVTVVEIAPGLKKGGTPVDIRESVVDVVRRMGLLERIIAESLPPRATEFLDVSGRPLEQIAAQSEETREEEPGWEIERDALLDMLFDRVKGDVEFIFSDSIATVDETAETVHVTFASGARRSFSLLLGCDGTHSAVRRMCFGEESSFLLFLEKYFSLTIVDKLLLPENTGQLYSVPGKTIMINAYHGKTDIAFCFSSAEEIAYDRRDRHRQKQMIEDHFQGDGWRTEELLREMRQCEDFYFDKLCQIRMPAWSKGRVALVGDAGYCPSPAAGMGGSMALLGATALADGFRAHPHDFVAALREYDDRLRPIVEEIQVNAVEVALKMFMPASEEEIRQRNARMGLR